MKKTLFYLILAVGVTLIGCEPELEDPIGEEGFYTTGSADLSNFVALGNSLTAGFADGALYVTGQENSFPNIMAQQFALAGGGEFTQPLMEDNLGGLLLNGSPIRPNRLVLSVDANGNAAPTVLEGSPATDVANPLSGPFNNMGVPGAKSYHLITPSYGNIGGVLGGGSNPYFARFATSQTISVLEDALALDPSFFVLWIGSNDILGYATSGGVGTDQAGNPEPSSYSPNDISDPFVFASVYNAEVDALVENGAGGLLVNIPDVTSIPFFTTVPAQSIPLDAASANLANSNFQLYNDVLLPALVNASLITQQEADARKVEFSEGLNYPIIVDEALTDVSAALQGPPANLPPDVAALLGQLRQANDTDLFLLTASSVLGQEATAGDPTSVVGVALPVADQFVLTPEEQALINNANDSFNTSIQAAAATHDLAFFDARAALAEVANQGVMYEGGILTDAFVTGGAFSLDGIHPTARGYAYTANLMIQAINAKYGATIPQVNIGDYPTVTAANN